MQNKPNFPNAQILVKCVSTKDYENVQLRRCAENKPNSNPIQTQSKPITANSNPIQSQFKPNQTQFQTTDKLYFWFPARFIGSLPEIDGLGIIKDMSILFIQLKSSTYA